MRKEKKVANNVQVSRVQQYHEGGYHAGSCSEAYAFAGFESNKYFNSDRYIKLDENFQRTDGQPLKGVGLEIESECAGVTQINVFADVLTKIIFPLFPKDLFKMQHDGSLGHRNYTRIEPDINGNMKLRAYDPEPDSIGIECITQVMTKAFIRNHYKDFKTMYNTYFPAFKISCSNSGRCGMHVNLSNALFGDTVEKQKENIRKLYYFVNKNFKLCCKLFKRNYDQTGYCSRMENDHYTIADAKHKSISGGGHGSCFNFSHFHFGRIELRLVGGQPDYYAFRNTIETVFFLVERMSTIRWEELDDITTVFKGCNNYVVKRLMDCNLTNDQIAEIRNNSKYEDLEIN